MNGGSDTCLLNFFWYGTHVIGVRLNFYGGVVFKHISISAYSCKTYRSYRNNVVTCFCHLLSLCVARGSDVLLSQKHVLVTCFCAGIYRQSFRENARIHPYENERFWVVFTKTHVYKFQRWSVKNPRNIIHFFIRATVQKHHIIRASAPEARYPDVLLLQKHATNTCFCSRSTPLTRASVGLKKMNVPLFHQGDVLLLPVARIISHEEYSFGVFFHIGIMELKQVLYF